MKEVGSNRGRPDYSITNRLFNGCDVCWTCKLFDYASNICHWRTLDGFIEHLFIENPEWWRCQYWTEKKGKD